MTLAFLKDLFCNKVIFICSLILLVISVTVVFTNPVSLLAKMLLLTHVFDDLRHMCPAGLVFKQLTTK